MARGGGSFDPSWRKVEVKILFHVWARGGGSFDPSWRKVEVKIQFNVLARGDGGALSLVKISSS